MKKILLLCAVLETFLSTPVFSSAIGITPDPGQHIFQNVTKIDDGLYTSPMTDQPGLRLVMEKITGFNIVAWKKYLEVQNAPRVVGAVKSLVTGTGKHVQKGNISDGSGYALRVLNSVSIESNEVWMAYITSDSTARHITLPIDYQAGREYMFRDKSSFPYNLKMYMTVTSSPNALLTSHLGITVSAEGVFTGRPKGVSVDLHAFAAKVMLIRNPKRRFMVNAPVEAMTQILTKALPSDSLSMGTREMQDHIKKYDYMELSELKEQHPEIYQKILEKSKQETDREMEKLSINEAERKGVYDRLLQKNLHESFEEFKTPWNWDNVHKEAPGDLEMQRILSREKMHKRMSDHPPIISTQGKSLTSMSHGITISHPASQFHLEVKKGDKDYNWLSTRVFDPATSAQHPIAVDLNKLAHSK
ncbi:hypothetical protein [Candidatus Nucleicultrix amoebiphila]|jgi:hypothetical protein|uniref:Uncharacterized protein n=1 Tax=Candidatus Nucleicultrix amoebiphila FS5 TaxID=1414854 RepID=A0A1W6N4L2_9PROT|nr:hypothetical protein [Candidatus Nucleicultrix amoebiphila]ARN84708.1 hypothetical protein GQ61_04645 [Candidatus Nucleicultrix amoebiphila FS5]